MYPTADTRFAPPHLRAPKPASIGACPDWIVEQIVAWLDLADIRSLRLTCKTVSIKSSQGRFQRLLQSKSVDLTSEALQTFTATRDYSSQLKNLNLVGLARKANLQADADKRRETETSLLTEAFDEIAQCKDNGCLESLTLRVAIVYQDGTRLLPVDTRGRWGMPKRVWACAVETWQVTLRALTASQLRIKRLNVFNDADMQLCSLPCDRLNTVDLQDAGLAKSLAAVKSLSLSISDRIFDDDKDMYEPGEEDEYYDKLETESEEETLRDFHAEAGDDNNFVGVAKLVKLCTQMEDLEFHYYRVFNRYINVAKDFRSERILQCVVELENLPRLRQVKLRGIQATERDLLNFIKRTDPSDLSLETIKLEKGTFASIIHYCTSNSHANLHALQLDTLYERGRSGYQVMVQFSGREGSRTVVVDATGTAASERLERRGADIRQPVLFSLSHSVFIGAPSTAVYKMRQRLEFYGN
ncbi:hypothetical protein FQN49_001391 [Arthroderma sp. PD_2]|nr:hypothetical protein FQN49_001391 [Arthroderma sp. PD_2]